MFSFVTHPFIYSFMQNALISAVLVSSICAILSCYLILKGWSLMGDAISHAVLPGVVIAFIIGIPLSVGAFLSGIFCALSVGFVKENSRIKEDTTMGIIFSGMFAFGIVLFAKIQTSVHITHILLGSILGVSNAQLRELAIVSIFVGIVMITRRKDFLLYCFDPNHAKIVGLSPRFLHYLLLTMLSLTIVSAIQIVGVILVVAMLIAPGITAFVITKRFDLMLLIALISSVSTSVIGLIVSFHIDSAPGATIILLQAFVFGFALIISKLRMKKFVKSGL